MRTRPLAPALAVLLALPSSVGCGRKADPEPPVVRVAQQIRDLAVYQEAESAVLSFGYPSMTTAGGPLPDLETVEVWRAHLPPAQEPHGDTSRDRDLASQLLRSRGTLLTVLDRAALDAATRGSSLVVRDDLHDWYEANREQLPLVLWYGVRSTCCGGRMSAFSSIARLEPQLPPSPPEGLTLTPEVAGVRLAWLAVEGLGALVERSADGSTWESATAEPVSGGEWLDTGALQGQRWSYRLRAVRGVEGGGRVVGEPGPTESVDHPDVYPPQAPRSLVCLPEGQLVRLLWEAAADASSYRILRRRGDEPWVRLRDSSAGLELEDSTPPTGSLTYAVKVVDRAGNESEAAICTTVMAAQP